MDVVSGEVFEYNSNNISPQIAIAIPIGGWITKTALEALAASAIVIISGATFVTGSTAVSKINNQKKRKYSHYSAIRSNNKLFIGNGLSRSSAISRAKSGKDVWSVSKNQAKEVAKGANRNGPPYHEIDKNRRGKYYHWHPFKKNLICIPFMVRHSKKIGE